MRKSGLWIALLWAILILVGSCAKRGTPTGGDKDTIPPQLVRATPTLETVNFSGDEIELEFNELIEARNLKKELIVTPPIEDYDFYVKKNNLFIKLKEKLLDSTTYTFNFGEAIQDLSEKNKAENAVIAFSTGTYIDSFQVRGTVRQLLTQEPAKDAIVALYNVKDTLDAFTGPPMYFARTGEDGKYTIRYIKQGRYRIYSYNDINSNLKAETNKESYSFVADTLLLGNILTDATTDSLSLVDFTTVDMSLVRKDMQPLTLQSSRPSGQYYEFKFNKGLSQYTLAVDKADVTTDTKNLVEALNLSTVDSVRYLFDNLQNERKVIRVYNTIQQDSLRVSLTAIDSIGQAIDSTVYVQFADSRRQPEEFQTQFDVQDDAIEKAIESTIMFSKPVLEMKTDSILLGYDTLFYLPINYAEAFSWNETLDEVKIRISISREQLIDSVEVYQNRSDSLFFVQQQERYQHYVDSIQQTNDAKKRRELFNQLIRVRSTTRLSTLQDSIQATKDDEAASQMIRAYVNKISISDIPPQKNLDRQSVEESLKPLNFYAAPGSFVSVEQDSNVAIVQRYTFKDPEKYGTVSGTIDLPYQNYFLQLVNNEYEVVKEVRNPKHYTFRMILPGTYRLRVLVDTNDNGRWEDGNILLNQEPEPVLLYPEEVVFRENWEVNDVNVTTNSLFTPSSE